MLILLNHSNVKKLARQFKNVGVLFSPARERFYGGKYPYAIDNGAFSNFDPNLFLKTVKKAQRFNPPLFVVAPDVVCDHAATLELWHQWQPILAPFNFPIAFVAQNGCDNFSIPTGATWVFIGGDDDYKNWAIRNLKHRPLHCGRVNGMSRLWTCFNYKITSVDGSAWFRDPTKNRVQALQDFLLMTNGFTDRPSNALFDFTNCYT